MAGRVIIMRQINGIWKELKLEWLRRQAFFCGPDRRLEGMRRLEEQRRGSYHRVA